MSKLLIYQASAGSGKTYRITEEYLKLLFSDPLNYRHILAVTFTNKATSEMKERIIRALFGLSNLPDPAHMQTITDFTGKNEQQVRELAKHILNILLHHFSRFSVMTIDTFFQGIIRAFARETGFQAAFNIELDNSKVLNTAVDDLLLDMAGNKDLKSWLIMFAEDKIESGRNWNLNHDLVSLGNEIFSEKYRSSIRQNINLDEIKNYRIKLKKKQSIFESYFVKLGLEALCLINRYGLTIEDFPYGRAGFAGFFRKMAEMEFDSPGKRVFEALEQPEKWTTRNSPKSGQIFNARDHGLFDILKRSVDYYMENISIYNSCSAVTANLYALGILSDISAKVNDYKIEKNVFLLSDAPSFLDKVISGNDSPFIYEKTGSYLKHYMIDEFQDTSGLQWNDFRPLFINSMSENNLAMIVGDVKQSIYRWRNGDWKLLAGFADDDTGMFGSERINMEENYRSRENIVNFNNHIFKQAPALLQRSLNSEMSEGAGNVENTSQLDTAIISAYEGSQQILPGNKKNDTVKGQVVVSFVDGVTKSEKEEIVLGKIPKIIEDLQDRKVMLKDIAILVRRKEEGRKVADALIRYKNSKNARPGCSYDLISNESLYIENSPVVRFILNVLRFIARPDDLVNNAALLFHLNQFRNNEVTDPSPVFVDISPEKITEVLSENIEKIEELRQLPVYELIEEISLVFGLNLLTTEIPFLQAFEDIALDYSSGESPDPVSFLEWWTEEGSSKSIRVSEQQDAIRILTIHSAKGLQFKVVIIPFCDWKLDHEASHDYFLWCTPDKEPLSGIGAVPVKYRSKLASTVFRNEYFTEKMQTYVDNLNLMYVAFTRAISDMYIFASLPVKTEVAGTAGNLLYELLANQSGIENQQPEFETIKDNDQLVFTLGTSEPEHPENDEPADSITLSDLPAGRFIKKLNYKANAKDFFTSYSTAREEQIDYGKMMHEIFSDVQTIEDIEKSINNMYSNGLISPEEYRNLNGKMQDILKNDLVRDWYSGDWIVKNESPILTGVGKMKIPDRILISGQKAVVIDYKFGETKREQHNLQVREYISLLRSMGYNDIKGYLWYFNLGEISEITA
ncbi:MAG: UvrD-helicase domain-containing protein [Bacteroidia bacterium]|nr:UvrD-helicase domain-containing protein [Bacteroidia bacterium]